DAKFGKDIQAHIDMYNEAKEFSGLKLLIPYKDHSERRDANAIIERDKAVIVDIAKLFKRFRNILVNHGEKEIELGITVHMAVLGYRTNPDFIGTEMYAINPFALDVNTLKSSNFKKAIEAGIEANHLRANALVHVLIHEYAHNNVSDHYEAFTHEMFRLYMILGHELLASLAKDARAIYENHEEGFERISKSLESLGKSGTRFYAAGDATRNIWYAKRPKKDSRAKQKVSDEQEPTAKFLGYQVGVRGETVALYNVVGGRLNNSTVSANTLRKENIKVPETPDYEEKYTLQSRPNDKIISGIDIQKMFPGQTVGITNKNEHWVRFKNGQGIIVENVKYVESGAGIEMKVRHGKMQKKGPLASGSYKDGVIKLRKLHADTWTLAHESIHMLEDLGIITSAEISRIKRTIRRRVRKGLFSSDKRNEVGGPEDRANYIADILYKSDNSTGIQVIIDKVIDFLNQLVNYVTRTTPGIISDIKSGRIYDKAAKRGSILTPGSTPFYSKPAAMWYSKMRKELEQLLPKKSTPVSKIKEQILELSDPDRKGGAKFKREEVIFSGLLDMLDELTIMDETVIQVDKDGLKFAVADPYTDDTMMNTVDPLNYWGITAAQLSDFEQRKKQGVTTNKAEVLRYLEQTNLPMGEEWRGEGYSQSGKYPGTFYTLPGGTKYQEIVFLDPYVSGLKTGHFTGDNIIFHLRFDERIDDKNRRILFIQEIQSDHHQQAARLVKRFRKRLRILGFEKHEIDPMVPSGYKRPMGVQFNTLEQAKGAVYYDANQVVNFKSKKQGTLSARKSTGDLYLLAKNNQGWIVSGLDQKDSVNFSNLIPVRHAKTWPLQAMRRMIRYAVEQGSDDQGRRIAGIAWTTGKMQVERYTKHLQQNVDEIRWEKVVGPQSLSGPTKIMISRVYELPDGNWTIARGYAPHTETPTHYLTGNEQWSGNFEEAQYYETHTSAMEDLTRLQNIEPEQQHFYVLNTHTMENILADELMQADDGTTTVSTREEAERLRDEFLEAFPEETPANFEVHEVVFLGEELPAEEQGLYPEEQDPTYNTDLINYDDVEIVPISQIGYTSNYAINEGIIDKFILVIPSDIIEDSWDYLSETGDTAYDELQYAGLYDTLKEAKRALVKFRLKNKKIQRPNT
ncbi:hypothetical protein H8E88_31925, partial [candidate division KSB1 bacterium]|nr:hypothetical protein [candidate division KSB1 bacterium]